ncbi:MAG: ATP-binding cassette domain-containing protein [Actinobacteria bacterium]|nr:ATP-binding cassette domain-containing protein [Actinomycetota bacterium]
MLRIHDLHSSYGLAEVLSGISMEVPDGTLVAVMGRNGMGKTTLCRSIMGLAPPVVSGGEIECNGTALGGLPAYRRAQLGIGYVPQGRHVFTSLNVVENLTVAARSEENGNEPWDLDRVWELFPRLAERKTHRAGQLSGGEQQMLAIARALMTNPGLLVMDEPSEGLAPVLVETLAERLHDLKSSALSILLVEQNLSLALRLADVVYVVENGGIVFHGTPAELDGSEEIKRRHLGVGV